MTLCSNSLVCLELSLSLVDSAQQLMLEVENMLGSMAEMISNTEEFPYKKQLNSQRHMESWKM